MSFSFFVDGLPEEDLRRGDAMIAWARRASSGARFEVGPRIAAGFNVGQWEIFTATPSGNGLSPIFKAVPNCEIS
jgi:hypothetical protein